MRDTKDIWRKRNLNLTSRNEDLSNKVTELQNELDFTLGENSHSANMAKGMIRELESLKLEQEAIVADLRKQRDDYQKLMKKFAHDTNALKRFLFSNKFFNYFQRRYNWRCD